MTAKYTAKDLERVMRAFGDPRVGAGEFVEVRPEDVAELIAEVREECARIAESEAQVEGCYDPADHIAKRIREEL